MTQYSLNYPMQSGDYTKLRSVGTGSSYGGKQYASMLPNTVVFAARFNSAQSGNSFAQEEWSTASVGAYTDALPGQAFFASASNNINLAYFTGRVRKSFGATTAYFNETSISQGGTDYFWVIDDYPIMDKLLRFLIDQPAGSPAYRADYDIVYRPMLPIVGSANDAIQLHGAYAGFVNGSNKFRISISALFYPVESAATITSWSINIVDGTLIAGSLTGSGTTTGTVTIDFPPGFRHVLITVTNSAGETNTCAIKVWAEVRSASPTLITGFNGATINMDVSTQGGSMSGNPQTCSLEMFTNELSGVLDNTPICIWDEEVLSDTLGSVGGNVRFIGRLRKEQNQAKQDPLYVRTLKTQWSLEGPDTQLNRLTAKNFLISMIDTATPADWGQIKSMTLYRAMALLLTEFSTFTQGQVVNWDVFDDTFPYPALNTAGSTPLGILNDLATSLDALCMFTGDGRMLIARHAFYLSSGGRSGLSTVANWGNTDRTSDLNLNVDTMPNVMQVDAWGGERYNLQTVTPLHAQAPGLAPDRGDRGIPLLKQVLANVGVAAAQTELDDRAGCCWQKEAQPFRLVAVHPPGYGFMWPDISAWYTWTISASDNLRGYTFDTGTRWILEKVSYTHDNKAGIKKIDATYLKETNGIGMGNTIPIITSNTLPTDQQQLALGVFPLIQPITPPTTFPGPDAATLKAGIKNLALILSDGTVTLSRNFNQTPPTWTTPVSLGVSGTVIQWVPDFNSGYFAGSGTKSYGWIVTTTGVYYGDINTPSFSLGHTFRATSSLRSASASLRQPGHIVIVTDYSDGTYFTYATTGANWTSEAALGTGAGTGTYPPGCWYSQTQNNVVFASVNGAGYKSTDGGATWSTYAGIAPNGDCAACIVEPYQGNAADTTQYYTKWGGTTTITYDFTQSDQGWAVGNNTGGQPEGVYVPGVGWTASDSQNIGGDWARFCFPFINFSPNVTVTSVTGYYTRVNGTYPAGPGADRIVDQSSDLTVITPTTTSGSLTIFYSGTDSGVSEIAVEVGCSHQSSAGALDGSCVLTKAVITVSIAGAPALTRYNGASADVSPLPAYAPWKSLPQISISLNNSNIIGVAAGNNDQSLAGIFISSDGANSWSELVAPVADGSDGRYDWIPMSGNATPILYPAGSKGRIGYSAGLAGPIVDKRGNLSTSASVVGLAGFSS